MAVNITNCDNIGIVQSNENIAYTNVKYVCQHFVFLSWDEKKTNLKKDIKKIDKRTLKHYNY